MKKACKKFYFSLLIKNQRQRWCVAAIFLLLAACTGNRSEAPLKQVANVEPPAKYHVVKKGESLYTIAWRYGLDYSELARLNRIKPPYMLRIGQQLRLTENETAKTTAKKGVSPEERRDRKQKDNKDVNLQPSRSQQAIKQEVERNDRKISSWLWPAKGAIVKSFSPQMGGNKGIDIAGQVGDQVLAAAAGKVVYSGSGLRGYGRLIIIKHNDYFLSAYAHNNKLYVREDDIVKAGQVIADIGSNGERNGILHFEIRYQGKPVDPLLYLPRRAN